MSVPVLIHPVPKVDLSIPDEEEGRLAEAEVEDSVNQDQEIHDAPVKNAEMPSYNSRPVRRSRLIAEEKLRTSSCMVENDEEIEDNDEGGNEHEESDDDMLVNNRVRI